MPPDGWGTRATYQAPPETSREDIVDFFLSELSPEWQSCVIEINVVEAATGKSTQMMGGASFTRGSSVVSIDTDNMLDEAPHTFDISWTMKGASSHVLPTRLSAHSACRKGIGATWKGDDYGYRMDYGTSGEQKQSLVAGAGTLEFFGYACRCQDEFKRCKAD